MVLIFQSSQKNVFREHFATEANFIIKVLKQSYKNQPQEFKGKIREISKELNWNISYWKGNTYIYYTGKKPIIAKKNNLIKLNKEKSIIINQSFDNPLEFISFVDEKFPEKGYIILRFGNARHTLPRILPFVLSSFLILSFLALLLIPYSLYILKPFKKLMFSINKVSQGDFSHYIEVSSKSEFKDLADAFNNMTKKIQEMINQKQRLIADVSHELRSPLTRMRLGLEILSKDPLGRVKYIDKSITEIESLNSMIESILEISKLELDNKVLNLEVTELKSFLEEQINKNQILFDEHRIKINIVNSEKPYKVFIDKNLFERAISNIFSNVVKYSPKNSFVQIILDKNDKNILISIKDKGLGVKEDELEKIFETFYRTDDSRSRKTGGTGLGLSIVKKIIESHSGKVWASLPINEQGLIINIQLKEL